VQAIGGIPFALQRYRKETLRLIADQVLQADEGCDLAVLRAENQRLARETKRLQDPAEIERIARVGFPGRILSPGEAGVTLAGTKSAALAVAGQGLERPVPITQQHANVAGVGVIIGGIYIERAVGRHVGLGSQSVIGNRLGVVSLGPELAQLATEPGLVSRQPGKLSMHALVGLGVSARAFRDQRLRRMKPAR